MADLIARKVFRFAGKTYAHHWYSNGDMWLIVATDARITARQIVPDGRAHHLERMHSDHHARSNRAACSA